MVSLDRLSLVVVMLVLVIEVVVTTTIYCCQLWAGCDGRSIKIVSLNLRMA